MIIFCLGAVKYALLRPHVPYTSKFTIKRQHSKSSFRWHIQNFFGFGPQKQFVRNQPLQIMEIFKIFQFNIFIYFKEAISSNKSTQIQVKRHWTADNIAVTDILGSPQSVYFNHQTGERAIIDSNTYGASNKILKIYLETTRPSKAAIYWGLSEQSRCPIWTRLIFNRFFILKLK